MDGTSRVHFVGGVFGVIADFGGIINPTLDTSERKAMVPALSEPHLCSPSTLVDHRGNGKKGLVTCLSLDSEKTFCICPFSPNLPFVPQFDDEWTSISLLSGKATPHSCHDDADPLPVN